MARTTKLLQICLAVATASMPSAAVAQAKTTFSAYEGPARVEEGQGGTKISKNGIDYWTSGTPPRRYQIVGMIEDKRDEENSWRTAIGSPKVARLTKAAGGDAVIIQSREEAGKAAGYGAAYPSLGYFFSGGSKTITVMLAVKYLLDETENSSPETSTHAATPAEPRP